MKKIYSLLCTLMAGVTVLFSQVIPEGTDYIVAKDGSGDYSTIQSAIDAAPTNSSEHVIIYIKSGEYEEYLDIPSTKPNLVLYGENNLDVIITYKTIKDVDGDGDEDDDDEAMDEYDLATIQVYATGFIAYNVTFENTAGTSFGPAQAIRQEVDKAIYVNCRIIANQDTYRTTRGRAFHKNCYIEGTVDFIFGRGTYIFEDCDIYSKGGSAITAPAGGDAGQFGYIFRNCRVVSKKGTNTTLGRPWKENAATSFINCELPSEISSAGWAEWDGREETAQFSEYMNYGPGAKTASRVSWSSQLTEAEAETYNTVDVLKYTYTGSLDNWNPYEVLSDAGIPGLNNEGDGYGMNEGGNGGDTVTVSTESELRTYAQSNDKYVIKIKGDIELTSKLKVGSNTTITGINEESGITGIEGASLHLTDQNENIIIKYLNITNPDVDGGGDGLTVWNAQNVLITHVSFYDCDDGSCDINRGSDSVTVSWCKFYYPTQEEHRFTMIADGGMTWDDDGNVTAYTNKLNVTLHHNWWYVKSHERMPSSTNTNAHMYNNYWNCVDNYYCSNARHETEFYSENNYYDRVGNPLYKGETDGLIYASGNVYNSCTGDQADGTDSVFTPYYPYLLTKAASVPNVVTSRAGNVWNNPPQYTITTNNDGNGTTTGSGSSTFNEGRLVSRTATPNSYYKFSNWTGDKESKKNPLVFYVDTSYTITANFEIDSSTLDISDLSANSEFTIFPNPSNGTKLFIKQASASGDNFSIQIYNLNGELIYKENNLASELTEINPGLSSGSYILKLISNKETFSKLISVTE